MNSFVLFPGTSCQDTRSISHPPGRFVQLQLVFLSSAVPVWYVGVSPCHAGDRRVEEKEQQVQSTGRLACPGWLIAYPQGE